MKSKRLPGCQDENGTGVEFQTGADSGHGDGLDGGGRTRSKVTQLVEDVEMRDGNLGQQAGLMHHTNSLARVGTLGGLTGQHDTVRTVQDGVGNIGHLSPSGTGVVCHGLEHLSGTDDRLTLDVTLGDHHLLSDKDLGGGNLDAQVTTGNHDTVSLLEDLVKVVDTLLILNLGNDLDLPALFAQDFTNVPNVASATDKRSKDHVDVVLDTELQVVPVLLGQSREVNVGLGQVDTLTRRDVTVVKTLATQGLIVYDLKHLERENTVVDIDQLAGGDHLSDVLIVDEPADMLMTNDGGYCQYKDSHVLVIATVGKLVVRGDGNLLALLDGVVLVVDGVAGTDLRSFLRGRSGMYFCKQDSRTHGVKGNGKGTAGLSTLGLTGVVNDRLVVLIGAVGEVHANNVKTG